MMEALLDELKDLVGRMAFIQADFQDIGICIRHRSSAGKKIRVLLVRTTEALSGASLLVSELKSCVAEIVEEEELDEG